MLDRPAASTVTLTVNGKDHEVAAAPFASLADTLREGLGLTGTKVGCDAGDCGACTVLLDGAQVCACLVATAQAEGRAITTIEASDPLIDRLRAAFLAEGAAQCGICTPGMIMAAADLLARNPSPTRSEIEDGIGGVLCRCTGYAKIIEAIDAVARGANAYAPVAEAGCAVGARIARADGLPKVQGTDRFGADHAPEGALWMRAVRSPHARARFTLGDLAAVKAAHPGLEAILTAADIPGANSFGIFPTIKDQPVLAPGFVRYRGEAILALVGTREAVEGIADAALPITWEVEPALIGVEAALAEGATPLHANIPDNVLTRGYLETGDVTEGHRLGAATAEGRFRTGFVEHAYIEPEAGYAIRVGDRIEVTACTQAAVMDQEEVARVVGVPMTQVRIIPTACGGGFGGKLDVSIQPLIAVAAWLTKKPVRIVYSRTESMASTTKRHPSKIQARMSADASGRFTAYEMQGDFNTGAYASWGPTVANRVPVHATGPYKVPHVRNATRAVHTNEVPAGAFRGFGVPQAAIAGETLIDDLAERLGARPLADPPHQRHRPWRPHADRPGAARLGRPARMPRRGEGGVRRAHGRGRRPQCEGRPHGPRRRRCLHVVRLRQHLHVQPVEDADHAHRDGRLTFLNGAVDIGQGSSTVLLQIAADALGLPPQAFGFVIGDTDKTFDAGKTSASRQTFVSGNASRLAGADLRAKILALANAGPTARLALEGSRLTVEDGEASRVIDLATLAADEAGIVLMGDGEYDPPTTALDAKGQGIPYAPMASPRRWRRWRSTGCSAR